MQQFKTKELKQRIINRFGSIAELCKAAGITNPQRYEQALEQGGLTRRDIERTANALEIEPQEIDFYFFRPLEVPKQSAEPCKV